MSGTPVPSLLPEDFSISVADLDRVVNSEDLTYINRLGFERRTLAGLSAEFPNAQASAEAAANSAEAAANSAEAAANSAEAAANSAEAAANSAEAATSAAALAASALAAAEVAIDSAALNADVYADVSAGLAAVVDGEQFQVVSADGLSVTRYQRNPGPIAVEVASYPTSAAVFDLSTRLPEQVRFVVLPPESGWLFGVFDYQKNLAIAVDAAGKTWLNPRSDLHLLVDNMPQEVQDLLSSGGISEEFKARLLPEGFSTIIDTPPESGFIHSFTDQLRRVGFGIKQDGTFWAKLAEDIEFPSSLATAAAAAIIPNPVIECWGDSMTAGAGGDGTTYPGILSELLGRVVNNRGIGGQTSKQIISRQGGIPLTVTVAGNEIPASGGVAVTAYSTNILRSSGVNWGTNTGTLAGVPGVLSTDLDANWTFTRTASGGVISCPPGSGFTPDLAVAGRDKTVIFWVGRNDANTSRAERMATLSNALSGVDYLDRKDKRVLILSVCNSSGETIGSTAYNEVAETNEALKSAFGDCFLDIRKYLVDYGLDDAGMTPTSQDLIDIAADVIPSSLRSDSTHLAAAGYTLVANFVARAIRAKGW